LFDRSGEAFQSLGGPLRVGAGAKIALLDRGTGPSQIFVKKINSGIAVLPKMAPVGLDE
jgi:hypothetical protein